MRTRTGLLAAVWVLCTAQGVLAEGDGDPGAGAESEPEPEPEPEPEADSAADSTAVDIDEHVDALDAEPDLVLEPLIVERALDEGCAPAKVVVKRMGVTESLTLALTDCEGAPRPEARIALSALALPPKRTSVDADAAPPEDPLPQMNPELVVRLQRIADRYPGQAIEIVSGYRARARQGSRHRTFDALDLRVEGVSNEELSEVARTFEGTGVGYYPNSHFVHVDVRESSAHWVDRSAPGEAPKYAATEQPAAPAEAAPGAEPSPADAAAAEPADAANVAAAETEEAGAVEPAGTEPAKPSAPEPTEPEPAPGEAAEQLASLAERALVIMNRALDRSGTFDRALPERREL